MVDYLLDITVMLLALSFLCFVWNIYGWRKSLLISGIGVGIFRFLIEEIYAVIPEVNQKAIPFIYAILIFYIF